MVRPHVPGFTPPVHDVLQELRRAPAVQQGNRANFHPLGERINRDEEESVAISVLRKWTRGIDTPAKEGCCPLVDPSQLLQWQWRYSVLLQHLAAAYAVAYILLHT